MQVWPAGFHKMQVWLARFSQNASMASGVFTKMLISTVVPWVGEVRLKGIM